MKVGEFESVTVEYMDFIMKVHVNIVLLNELKEFRTSPNDALAVPKENSGVQH